jgi:hypothetical protein
MSDAYSFRHEPERRRFVATVDDAPGEAVVEYRPRGEGVLEYYHTFTPRELRGRGIAGRLVAFALDYAIENDYRVVPTCPFVAKVLGDDRGKYAGLAADPGRAP